MNKHYTKEQIKELLPRYSNKTIHELGRQCVAFSDALTDLLYWHEEYPELEIPKNLWDKAKELL